MAEASHAGWREQELREELASAIRPFESVVEAEKPRFEFLKMEPWKWVQSQDSELATRNPGPPSLKMRVKGLDEGISSQLQSPTGGPVPVNWSLGTHPAEGLRA